MTKRLTLALQTACAVAFSLVTSVAVAQTSPPGRTAFDQKGCRSCHAYSSRRGAPSVRDLLVTFEAEPEKALQGIKQAEKHLEELATSNIAEKELRMMAEWISGASFPEPEHVESPEPPAPAPAVALAVQSSPDPAVPTIVITPAVLAVPKPQTPIARQANPRSVIGLIIEPGKRFDQLLVTLSGRTPDDLDIKSVDGKLVITLPGVNLADNVPAKLDAPKGSKAVNNIETSVIDGTLTITVAPRTGDIKYNAIQGRSRLSVELTTLPSKKKPVPAPLLTAMAVAPASPPPASPPAVVKPAVSAKPPSEKATTPNKQAFAKLPTDVKAEASAKPAAVDNSKALQEAKAKQEAEAKAKKEADAIALAKKDAEVKAAKKDADEKAKRESSVSAKAELEMLAALKASAEALKGSASVRTGGSESDAKGGKRDRSKLKAPEKFRDEPCPPIANSDPIGNVDETKAKDIIDRVGCPQCHAFVQKKTGPPFKKVFEKVKGNPSCVIQKLKKNKEHNEEGVTDDLKGSEFKIVADYLATRAK